MAPCKSPTQVAALVSTRCSVVLLVQAFLEAGKPVTAAVLVHNGMNRAIQQIQTYHPRLHFAALSPHVAAAARHALKIHTNWLLPTFTFVDKASNTGVTRDPIPNCVQSY